MSIFNESSIMLNSYQFDIIAVTDKVRTDLTRNYTDLKILVVEIRERNKSTPSLVCTVYPPSSIKVEKLEWIEKFEQFLANLYTTWNGVLIIIGDFNINLLSHQNESTNNNNNM